ncbi:MAG: SusF/SusE family outer membrane protein, partial [Salegentibacter sp.]
MKKLFSIQYFFLLALLLGAGIVTVSCSNDELDDPSLHNVDDELNLSVSDSAFQLQEKFINNQIAFNWSTGTNMGTGAAISYTFEIDLADGDFSDPVISPVENEQSVYSYSVDYGTLNDRLLSKGLAAGETYDLQARVTAEVADASVEDQVAVSNFQVTTYRPVSNQLYITGDATPNGWDISNAIELTASTEQRGVFTYEGKLVPGNFKFAVSQDDCFCQDFYTKDPNDDSKLVYNEGGSGDDVQWTISEEAGYKIRVDLLNKTISIEKVADAPFSKLWIVGDATESGWNVDDPAAFTQDEENHFIFTYTGNFNPGEFKVFAGPQGDFCGDWYRPFEDGQDLVDGEVNQNSGCEGDTKWLVTEDNAGRYKITLNTKDNTITFEQVKLYIVGDGSPSGWDINT